MTINELYSILNKQIPQELSCEWDNDGLMIASDRQKQVRRVLIALDATEDTVAYASENGFDAIATHHPLIFQPLKTLNDSNTVERSVISCIKNGISVMSFHTRLDAVDGGVNDALAAALGLTVTEKLSEIGRIGELPSPVPFDDFVSIVREALGCDSINFVGDCPVHKVALCGGDGKDLYDDVRLSGADTYVTGSLSYNMMAEAAYEGINVIEAGHFHTEHPVCEVLAKMIGEQGIDTEIFYSNPVGICLSDNFLD